jgi:ribosomal protein L11 methyltransferase
VSKPPLPLITVTAAREHEEPILARLQILGLRESEILHPAPDMTLITIYGTVVSSAEVREDLAGLIEWFPDFSADVRAGEIEDIAWYERWKEHFHPLAIGERFEVRPPWETGAPPAGRVAILIEPKNAFGTGYHETTQLMIEALERTPLAGASYLDAGCGSGILSIAAVHLGAREVVAFDHDPESVENALENLEVNHVSDRVRAFTGEAHQLKGSFDVVGANIIANVLEEIRDDLVRLVRPGGRLLLSGLFAEDRARTGALYEAGGLTVAAEASANGWHLLDLRRPG